MSASTLAVITTLQSMLPKSSLPPEYHTLANNFSHRDKAASIQKACFNTMWVLIKNIMPYGTVYDLRCGSLVSPGSSRFPDYMLIFEQSGIMAGSVQFTFMGILTNDKIRELMSIRDFDIKTWILSSTTPVRTAAPVSSLRPAGGSGVRVRWAGSSDEVYIPPGHTFEVVSTPRRSEFRPANVIGPLMHLGGSPGLVAVPADPRVQMRMMAVQQANQRRARDTVQDLMNQTGGLADVARNLHLLNHFL
jgi:hypothetical protein